MSDDEMHSDEGPAAVPVETGPTEAEMALQRRKQQIQSTDDLDEFAAEILEQSRQRQAALQDEIEELRERNERRKAERAEEEKILFARRKEEEDRLKAEAEERKAKKAEEAAKKKAALAEKMAEFEKWKQPQARNFVITKKEGGAAEEAEEEPKEEKKSKEQLEAEKRAILGQRIHPLEISGFDAKKLSDKANELHAYIYRLESEKYDLEKRFKEQQVDMMELAERARSMNKVGKGGFKRVQLSEDQRDVIQEKYAGTSAKIEMYSKYERQKDKRAYAERRDLFTGPQYSFQAERITPRRILGWDEDGVPIYTGGSAPPPPEPEPAQEEVAAEEE